MKTCLKLLAVGLCAAALAGCGQSAAPQSGTAPQTKEAKVLRVGTDPNYPPFEYYQQASGSYTGFDTELITAVAQGLGYEKVEFVDERFAHLLEGLNEKRYDAVISCLSITDERKKSADFTRPYLYSGYAAVTRDGTELTSLDDLRQMKVAVRVSSVPEEIAMDLSDNVEHCTDLNTALLRLSNGAVDAVIDDYYVLAYYMANGLVSGLTLHEDLPIPGNGDLGIAVRKEDQELLKQLDEGVGEFRKTTAYDRLKRSYFGDYSLSF